MGASSSTPASPEEVLRTITKFKSELERIRTDINETKDQYEELGYRNFFEKLKNISRSLADLNTNFKRSRVRDMDVENGIKTLFNTVSASSCDAMEFFGKNKAIFRDSQPVMGPFVNAFKKSRGVPTSCMLTHAKTEAGRRKVVKQGLDMVGQASLYDESFDTLPFNFEQRRVKRGGSRKKVKKAKSKRARRY